MSLARATRWALIPAATAAILGALPPALAAQSTQPLSLADAEARALTLGPDVALVRERMTEAEAEVRRIRAGAFPVASANLAYNRAIRTLFDGLFDGGNGASNGGGNAGGGGENGGENPFADLPFGRANTWVAGVRVTQPLYAAGRVSIGLDIADHVRNTLRLELAETEAEVRLGVREAYLQAVFTELLVEIAEEAWSLADQQLQRVQGFRDQGIAADLDVLTARVERDNLDPRRIDARNAADLARLDLLRRVQLPPGTPIDLTTPLAAELRPVDAATLRAALEARPLLQASATRIRIEEEQVRLARSGYRPTAGAFLDLGWQAFPETVFPGSGVTWREDWSAGFQVSIPLFNGFGTRAEVDGARSGVRQAELDDDRLREGLLLSFESTLSDLESTRAQVEARAGTVEQARRAVELAELRFGAGSATALELSNTRLLLQQAQVNQAEALLRYALALARLERATGGTLPLLAPRLHGTPTP
jgi:outer membrane protein